MPRLIPLAANVVLFLALTTTAESAVLTASADYRPGGSPGGGVVLVDGGMETRTLTLSDPGAAILSVTVTANVSSSDSNTTSISSDGTVDSNSSEHWPSELFLWLTSPQGTMVELISPNVYGRAVGFSELVTLNFDDGGAVQSGDFINPGTFAPTIGSLADFASEDPTGNWTITVGDTQFNDPKSLNAWALTVTTVPEPGSSTSLVALLLTVLAVRYRSGQRGNSSAPDWS